MDRGTEEGVGEKACGSGGGGGKVAWWLGGRHV